ncbi:MAG: fumarate hydratase [Acidobacteriota bacterium]|nr:fumarate hydratase [Acidobacteriota bacterium]
MQFFKESILELIVQTSTNLPPDVREAMTRALKIEEQSSKAGQALSIIGENIDLALENEGPICQDTGFPTFEVKTPPGVNQIRMRNQIAEAVEEATRRGKLRPNSVDSLTGKNSGNNIGDEMPVIHFEQWEQDDVEVRLILKGGGCENKNIQYSLPQTLEHLGRADRDLEGVKKCILHAVWQAQGQGCAPGAIGVCIGSDRAHGYELAKQQLFRPLGDTNARPELRQLEESIMEEANRIGVGTMGFGGKASLIGCKIVAANRLPASFFVSVAYDCWAFRRLGIVVSAEDGSIRKWLYRDPKLPVERLIAEGARFKLTGNEIRLHPPLSEEDVRALKLGDVVLISGPLVTGRDALHHYLLHHDPPTSLHGGILYHCGPVMLKEGKTPDERWRVMAAGPTTSIREEPYEADVIRKFGVRAIMGKGGMGKKTLAALKEYGAVYLHAIGGAAQYYARCLPSVAGVDLLEELGVPEAMWRFEAQDFPAIVTMDAHGNSLHEAIAASTGASLEKEASGGG